MKRSLFYIFRNILKRVDSVISLYLIDVNNLHREQNVVKAFMLFPAWDELLPACFFTTTLFSVDVNTSKDKENMKNSQALK